MAPKRRSSPSPARATPKPKAKVAVNASSRAKRASPPREAKDVMQCFKLFDSNCDGKIDRQDLERVLTQCSPADAQYDFGMIFAAADANEDGVIDYEEFCRWVFDDAAGTKILHTAEAYKSTSIDHLPIKDLSGETLVSLSDVPLSWTVSDLIKAMTVELGPCPAHEYYDLLCGGEVMEGIRELWKFDIIGSDLCVVIKEDTILKCIPASVERAREMLLDVDKKDITEVRAMATPPAPLMIVCMCLVLLRPLGKEDVNHGWAGAKAMLGDTALLRSLREYNLDKVEAKAIQKINELLARDPLPAIIRDGQMRSISKFGAIALDFVLAIVEWCQAVSLHNQ